MGIDCDDPVNVDKPECRINYDKEKKLSNSLFNFCDKPENKDKPTCKVEDNVERDIKKIENKEVCDKLQGVYNEKDNSCLVPKMNYLSLNLNSFDDVIGKPYKQLIKRLRYEIATGLISNQLFDGPTGMAKSQIARLIPREYAKKMGVNPDEFERYNVKQISASDKLGVDFIRNQVVEFVRTKGFNGEKKFLVIDEADRLTPEAQNELKHLITEVIPRYNNSTVLIFTTNDMSKMDPTLAKSRRFQIEEFRPLTDADMLDMYREFSIQTGIQLSDDQVKSAIENSGGSPGNLLANMYRIYAGESPYDYSLNEYTLLKEKEKINLESMKISNEQKKIETLIEKERVEARKWATENLYNYTNEEILASLANSPDVPPEMKQEREKNMMALRELYMLKNHATPAQLEAKLKSYLKEKETRQYSPPQESPQPQYGGYEENQYEEQPSPTSLEIPNKITYEYGNKIRTIDENTPGGSKFLRLWALARAAAKNPELGTALYMERKHLALSTGAPEAELRAIIRDAQHNAKL